MKKFLITLLILALILSGTNLTAVHADELTPASDDSVLNQNIVFSQDDNPITGSSKINVNKVIKAEIKMSVNLDPDAAGHSCITKNNYITYALKVHLQHRLRIRIVVKPQQKPYLQEILQVT